MKTQSHHSVNEINRRHVSHFADLENIVQKYSAMEIAWKTQAARWEPSVPTQPLVHAKRVRPRGTPGPIIKKYKPITGRGTVLEGWLNGPCKIHNSGKATPTHSLRACWILRQVARSGEDLLVNNSAEHPRMENNNTVLIVFETFASNNRRKRALRSLAEVCHVATINPGNDMAITFNASDEPKFRTARPPAALVLNPIVGGFRLTNLLMDGGGGPHL